MIDTPPVMGSEPELVLFQVYLQGQGAAAPKLLNVRTNFTMSRSGVGVYKITFNDTPGPTFLGICGVCFGDPTLANVAGWEIVQGAYVERAGQAPATLTFTVINTVFAATDLLATSTLAIQIAFKQAASVE